MDVFGSKKKVSEKELSALCLRYKASVRRTVGSIGGISVCGIIHDQGSGTYLDSFSLFVYRDRSWHLMKYIPSRSNYLYKFEISKNTGALFSRRLDQPYTTPLLQIHAYQVRDFYNKKA